MKELMNMNGTSAENQNERDLLLVSSMVQLFEWILVHFHSLVNSPNPQVNWGLESIPACTGLKAQKWTSPSTLEGQAITNREVM